MLIWIFGDVRIVDVKNTETSSKGTLILDKANVKFNLSINQEDLPWDEWKAFRSIKIDGEELEFSDGFTDLHKVSYEKIINGDGWGLSDVEKTIKLVEKFI